MRKEKVIIDFQAQVRGAQGRKKTRKVYEKKLTKGVTALQKVSRGRKVRKEFKKVKKATETLQRGARVIKLKKLEEARQIKIAYPKESRAVETIQRKVRKRQADLGSLKPKRKGTVAPAGGKRTQPPVLAKTPKQLQDDEIRDLVSQGATVKQAKEHLGIAKKNIYPRYNR